MTLTVQRVLDGNAREALVCLLRPAMEIKTVAAKKHMFEGQAGCFFLIFCTIFDINPIKASHCLAWQFFHRRITWLA
jgi:hypothetical protein